MRNKILFITDGLSNGGKERQLVETIKYLKQKDFVVGLITFNKDQHYSKIVEDLVDHSWFLKKRPTRLEPFFCIWKPIFDFNPDIVHTWDSLSSLYSYLPAKLARAKFVDNSIQDAGIDKGLNYLIKRLFIRLADVAIGNSIAGFKYYHSTGELVYNAIDPKRFFSDTGTSEFNIIKASSFSDYKDQATFLSASKILLEKGIVDFVYLAGDGIHKTKYQKYVWDNFGLCAEKVIFLGAVLDVETWLAKCRVGALCSTSKYGEGVSNSVLEYMSAGMVAIGTNIGGTSEIIQDGVNGFLIEEGDYHTIVDIVIKVKSDRELFGRIVQNAGFTLEEKFSYSNNCEKLVRIYRRLCNEE